MICFLPKEKNAYFNALVALSRALVLLELFPHTAADSSVCLVCTGSLRRDSTLLMSIIFPINVMGKYSCFLTGVSLMAGCKHLTLGKRVNKEQPKFL